MIDICDAYLKLQNLVYQLLYWRFQCMGVNRSRNLSTPEM